MTSARGMSSAVHTNASILTVNAGSSTIKFALFQVGQPLARVLSGKIERIGLGMG
jgi:acetate kinase